MGTSVTLAANCNGSPTAYVWSGCTPVASTNTCIATSGTPGWASYLGAASNQYGTSGTVLVQLNWLTPTTPVPPTCTIFSDDGETRTIGMLASLSAYCSGSPTRYIWTGCIQMANPSTCLATSIQRGQFAYTVTASNSAGSGPAASFNVTWLALPTPVPSCTVSASSEAPAAGSPVTLNATCTNNPTSYVWSNCNSTSATCVATAEAAGYVYYSVNGLNVYGTGVTGVILVTWLPVGAGPLTRAVAEFHHAGLDHYFMTANPDEIALLDSGAFSGWKRTGQTWRVFNADNPGEGAMTPVCRFYGDPKAGLDSHFYSASPSECTRVKENFPQWIWESDNVFLVFLPDPVTGACRSGAQPLYRSWNNRTDSNHRYAVSLQVRDEMAVKGYVAEGFGNPPVAMCVLQ